MQDKVSKDDFAPSARLHFMDAGESSGQTSAVLTPAIRAKLSELASGEVLEVRVSDPSAKDDILSWSRMSGNTLLGMFPDEPNGLRFYLRKK